MPRDTDMAYDYERAIDAGRQRYWDLVRELRAEGFGSDEARRRALILLEDEKSE